MKINLSPQIGSSPSDIKRSSWVLLFQKFSSAKFLSSFLSLSVLVKEGFPWICMLQNEIRMQLVALMSREAAKRKSSSPTRTLYAAAVALEQLQTQQIRRGMRPFSAFRL